LTNAVKFTPAGGEITLNIGRKEKGERENGERDERYLVSVSDIGIGMSPEEMSNLFRIDSMPSRKGTIGEQGTGLGLLVCKELLKKHGSTLNVESEEGKGSRFWFEI
jgi:signal transduction histidine kinase